MNKKLSVNSKWDKLELKIPPALLVALFAVAMWVIATLVPGLTVRMVGMSAVAGVFVAVGLFIIRAGAMAFGQARTTLDPRYPDQTSALVVQGIYRYSRNPMYLGFTSLLIAWAAYLGNLASVVLIPLFIAYMNRFQIGPEERALQAAFGKEYTAYRAKVRRWL